MRAVVRMLLFKMDAFYCVSVGPGAEGEALFLHSVLTVFIDFYS